MNWISIVQLIPLSTIISTIGYLIKKYLDYRISRQAIEAAKLENEREYQLIKLKIEQDYMLAKLGVDKQYSEVKSDCTQLIKHATCTASGVQVIRQTDLYGKILPFPVQNSPEDVSPGGPELYPHEELNE